MAIKEIKKEDVFGIKLTAVNEGREVGRITVYILKNDLHDKPFALLEDLFVEENHRRHGIATKLIKEAVETAKQHSCYKVIGTSRDSKKHVHKFFQNLGFDNWGREFRMNLE